MFDTVTTMVVVITAILSSFLSAFMPSAMTSVVSVTSCGSKVLIAVNTKGSKSCLNSCGRHMRTLIRSLDMYRVHAFCENR